MDLWQGPLRDFVRSAKRGSIAGDMTGRFVNLHGTPPSPAEVRSWQNSLGAFAEALRSLDALEVGVAIAARDVALVSEGTQFQSSTRAESALSNQLGVVTEYHLPLSLARIDVMLCGSDNDRRPRALVMELKQWSNVALEDEDAVNVLVDGTEHAHPSQQARDYADWLLEYHSAFVESDVTACSASYCHNMPDAAARPLRDARFGELLAASPLFVSGEQSTIQSFVADNLGGGAGLDVLRRVTGGCFRPSRGVLETLNDVLHNDQRWHLLEAQRVAHDAVLAEVRRLARRGGRSTILIRGGPGTGKTVIAVQLLADALGLGLTAAHSTGGKAFTTALRSKFRGADRLFLWNMSLRNAPTQALDLLLVDEAHRVRATSDTFRTPKARRGARTQVQELTDAARVTVFFLDEHQFVRPDEIGTSALIRETATQMKIRLREYDLSAQFRCGGCEEYVAWVDHLLGFGTHAQGPWRDRYAFSLVEAPEELQAMFGRAKAANDRARLVAGYCWDWSNAATDGSLVPDVQIGTWKMPWNRKRDQKKHYRPHNDPYTLWAETDEGLGQVGCIYSAQGFEFDRVGVIWGQDLVWRSGQWQAVPSASRDTPVRNAGPEMLQLVRNAYRVLLTRATRETVVLCLDVETRQHLNDSLTAAQRERPPR